MASGASSSSTKDAEVALQRYEVFLSFRGPDTRYGFVSHLFNALDRMGIKTYIDELSLERGNDIAYSLSQAIQESVISIVVFSENYASSRWCLDELIHILKCKESHWQTVVPVFYHVEPTHVRKQEGRFGEGFSKLIKEERFADKEDKWKTALTTASDLSGHTLSAQSHEANKVGEIVEDVRKKLYGMSQTSKDFKDLVGIERRVEKIKSLLHLDTGDDVVRPIGIWGMGGIGKTTLATVVFENVRNLFQGCCFLANVREKWDRGQREDLKKKLHSDLLREENPFNVTKRLIQMKVFLVLDDVNDQEQLEFLMDDYRFGGGSRIIVTTRDMQILRYLEADDAIYKVEELNDEEALKLFLLKAFNAQSSTADHYSEIPEKVVNYAKGIPLALKVLGSLLRSKKKEEWERYLNELKGETLPKIQKVLKVSYDHDLDEKDRSTFLDIACFFKLAERDTVEEILEAHSPFPYFSAETGINNLIEKSLLSIEELSNTLLMNDLVQQMGWGIVSSPKEPRKRSRLWIAEDICDVLENQSGTKRIEGIYLREDYNHTEEVDIGPLAFKGMKNLRFLKITKSTMDFPKGLRSLPHRLRYLYWSECKLESFPSIFSPQNLVELHMTSCLKLERLWSGVQNLKNLRHINLHGCSRLTQIPNLSRAPKLESINLVSCESLVEVPALNFKVFENRTSQKKFRKDHGTLDFSSCYSLTYFPNISGNAKRLYLTGCSGIDSIPPSIKDLSTLIELRVTDCNNLKALPQLPLSLGLLDATGCTSLETVATSKSEIIHAHCKDCHATRYKEFQFGDCLSLDQNSRDSLMTEFHVRFLSGSMPEKISSLFKDHKPVVEICLPGNAIPDWFKHRSDKSRITIKLQSNWQTKLIGFALCVVGPHRREGMIKCEYSFKTNDEDPSLIFKSNYEHHWTPETISSPHGLEDHLFIWYSNEDYHNYHDTFEISFEFYSSFRMVSSKEDVKRCGIHPLYCQDVEELGIKYGNPNIQGELDDIPEPHSKRTRLSKY